MNAKKQLDPDQERDIRSYVNGDGHRWMPDFGDLSALLAAHDYWRDLAQGSQCDRDAARRQMCEIAVLLANQGQRPAEYAETLGWGYLYDT